MKTLYTLVVEK